MRLSSLFLACCAFVGAAHAAPATVTTWRATGLQGATKEEFPQVSGLAPAVAQRINTLLFIDILGLLPPARADAGLREVPDSAWQAQHELRFTVLRNDGRVLSLRISGEGCGAYCESFDRSYAFDTATGRLLMPADLFTTDGQRQLAQRLQASRARQVARHLAGLKREAERARRKDRPSADEDLEDKLALFEDCARRRADPAFLAIEGLGEMEVGARGLAFGAGRCSNHAMQALDELGSLRDTLDTASLLPWLSPYGRALLAGGPAAPQPRTAWGQLLRGTVGDGLPIVMRLMPLNDDGSVGATYFYLRHREPIALQGQLQDGALELKEYGEGTAPAAVFRLRQTPTGLDGRWQQGGRSLPVQLAP